MWVKFRQICSLQLGRHRTQAIVLGAFETYLSKISERTGVSKELGSALVEQQEKLFELWHQVRDRTLARSDFIELVKDIRSSIKALLLEAAADRDYINGKNSPGQNCSDLPSTTQGRTCNVVICHQRGRGTDE